MALAGIDRLDDAVGAGVERLVVAHHRRRLKRRGWAHAHTPPDGELWCAGEPRPRAENAIEVLIDGETALPRLEREIAAAQHSVLLAGWTFTPSFRLSRGGRTLQELLAEVAARAEVRVLAWAGAPLPLFTPSRRQVREMADELAGGTTIKLALDSKERPMHCHHEKIAVIDGRIAYVGGIDLTTLAGDRFDVQHHPARDAIGWHDATARVAGPLVADVHDHVAMRWREVTGEQLEPAEPERIRHGTTAQFVRTVPNNVYGSVPDGDYRILEAYVRALRSAERLIYLESQFLWAPELVSIVAEKLRDPPTDEFRVVVLLPARPRNGADDTRGQLGVLLDADRDARFLACTLWQPGRRNQVYVHAKIGIVDDRWLAIGSANLNGHSLYNDTEACIVTCDEELAHKTRLRLWREHVGVDEVTFDHWRERAEDETYDRLGLLPQISRRARRFLGPVNGLLVDG